MINKIKNLIFGKKSGVNLPPSQSTPAAVQNPFTPGGEGRQEWNDRYMNMAKAVKNWQIACAAIAIVAIIQLIIIATLATQSKIKPYVVETAHGVPFAIRSVEGISAKDQLLINYAINQFVINSKTIIADTDAEKTMLDKVYAYSSGNTMAFLQDFYVKNNPFDVASNYTVNVNIISSLAISRNTWQVMWEEVKRNVNGGAVIETTKWIGQFTFEFGEVNTKNLNDNPFGIYISNVSWSQSK